MKKMKVLDDLLLDLVKDMYYAEKQIVKALPKLIKNVKSEELREAFENHLEETRDQVSKLEDIFEELGATPRAKKCPAIDGILEEGKEVLEANVDPDVLDAALIVAAQKVEHYEIASYGSIRTFAEQLGMQEVVDLAQEILDQEGKTDKLLTEIAGSINRKAENPESEDEEEEQKSGRKFSREREMVEAKPR
jgi:ferritin-like metal-binding protein YciE